MDDIYHRVMDIADDVYKIYSSDIEVAREWLAELEGITVDLRGELEGK